MPKHEGVCLRYRRNLQALAIACLTVYAGTVLAQAQEVIPIYTMPIPGFNVPLTVLAMALAGSFVGIAYAPPLESRKKLYFYAAANTLIGAWCVVLIPEWRGWNVSALAQPPLAGVLSATAIFWVPVVFGALPALAQKIMGLLSKMTIKESDK